MAIVVTLGGVDRTSTITMGSLVKKDALNQQTDTLDFEIIYKPTQTFRPTSNTDVIMTDDQSGTTTRVFGGKVYSVTAASDSPGEIVYSVKAKDYSYDLGRQLVNNTYENMTVNAIITDILANFTDGTFTMVNTNCTTVVVKIIFNRVTVIDAIQRLADMTNYSWYVDYNKDVHFFAATLEPAPFNPTDGDGSYISRSLKISDDFSQIRNRVFVQGGEIEGTTRTETFNGDTIKTTFPTGNKFSKLPTVLVGGVSQTVGIDFLDSDASFNCMWNFQQQYIRFTAGNIPGSGTNNVSISGIPLFTLVVQVEDPASILSYGVFEMSMVDVNIKSRDTAVGLAKAEISAYKNGVVEGTFDTYTPGLRAGQKIHVISTLYGIDEDFIIQSTTYNMINNSRGIWNVKLATLRTVNLIQFLIDLLRQAGNLVDTTGDVILEKTVFPQETIDIAEVIGINTNNTAAPETPQVHDSLNAQALNFAVIFVAGPYTPDPTNGSDFSRQFICDGSLLG